MTLNNVGIDEIVVIKDVNILGKERRRLYDLGLSPGVKIIKRYSSMFGDPVCYEVKETLIALRNRDAKCIEVGLYE